MNFKSLSSKIKNIGVLKNGTAALQARLPPFAEILSHLQFLEDKILDSPLWNHPIYKVLLQILITGLIFILVATPLDLYQQLFFGLVLFLAGLFIRNLPKGRMVVILLMAISISASLRYMYWRVTNTLAFDNAIDALFGTGLVLAEIYALLVLLLGFVQTAWPLQRRPIPLPKNTTEWPTVDVLIPTYNEPLNVVSLTVLAAQALDWPVNKFKVYVLDDGNRPEFRAFCMEAGVEYLTREGNAHAKAGNLNAALRQTNGEFVAIFDCDHIPTRSFLQMTMGWFLADPIMSMMQTPHFFFSPDPFERNLKTFRLVPNEGDLFYGLVQDGNDFWNASFFCGSCAVLRREALVQIGGIAIETVTEDAHTALKLSRKGYNIGYLAIPQAAGLATESLSAHVKQRIRWARGMGQIFRVDNPLLGKGLSLGQRMCYLNAMLHFFYGLPRLIFLTAPLAYLIFGAEIYHAKAAMIVAYAFPHILLANIANSKIQGSFRHSFWNEVYETVLAWYIMLPVMLALINPKLGAFNVTAKGGTVDEDFYDWRMARPYLIILVLSLIGLGFGIFKLITDEGSISTTLINLAWVFYNVAITSASAAVANESRQVRSSPRVKAILPATINLPNGKTIVCETTDFSAEGLNLRPPKNIELPPNQEVNISLFRGNKEFVLPGIVRRSGDSIGIQFSSLNLDQQRDLTQLTFSRADTWASTWGKGPKDSPLRAFREVLTYGLFNIVPLLRRALLDVILDLRKSFVNFSTHTTKQLMSQPRKIGVKILGSRFSKKDQSDASWGDDYPPTSNNKLSLAVFHSKRVYKKLQDKISTKLSKRPRFRQNKTSRTEE